MTVYLFFNDYENGVEFDLTAVPRIGEKAQFEFTPSYLEQFVPDDWADKDTYPPFKKWRVVDVIHDIELDEVSVMLSNQ